MTTERAQVERFLGAAQRRLARQRALERASVPLLAALIAAELALAFPAGQTLLSGLALVAFLIGLWRAASGPRPGVLWAASLLDARCESGATLASAAEALEGQHPRFGEWLLAEASALLAERRPGELLPWRPPAALVLGGAAAALLPLVLLQPSEAGPVRSGSARSLLDPVLIAGGGGGEGGEGEAGPDAEGRLALLPATPERPALSDDDPFAALPLDVAEELREQLAQLAQSLEGSSGGGSEAQGPQPGQPAGASPLEQALRRGDSEAARRALQELAEEAAAGDAAAQAQARELSQRARAGAGGSEGGGEAPPRAPAGPGQGGGPTRAHAGGLPPELRAAVQRYFEL